MHALAGFIMKGWVQAAVAAVGFTLLFLLFPLLFPAFWVSGAAIALVALRLGPTQGLKVLALAMILLIVVVALSGKDYKLTAWLVGGIWLATLLAASILRNSISLPLTLSVIAGLGMALVLLVYLLWPDHVADWKAWFAEMKSVLQQAAETGNGPFSGTDLERMDEFFEVMAEGITLSIILFLVTTVSAGLLVARWWQSGLFHPGGFAKEFLKLRFGAVLASVVSIMLVLGWLSGLEPIVDMAKVGSLVFAAQGFAVAHILFVGSAAAAGGGTWLIPVYFVVLLLAPPLPIALGVVDNWIDLRGRLRPGASD